MPPTSAVPPPASPEALMLAPPMRPTYWPRTLTVPPVVLESAPLASRVPLTLTTPLSPPSRTMVPLRLAMLLARITPSVLMTVSRSALALFAVRSTLPPSASIVPLLSAAAFSADSSTVTLIRPSPTMSRVTLSPAARATVPMRAAMTPSLATCGPSSAT